MKGQRIITSIIILLILVSVATISFAGSVKDLTEKKEDIENKIEETEEEIIKLREDTKDVSQEIEELDEKVEEAQDELEQVQGQLVRLQEEIAKTKVELTEAEENIEDKDDTFKKRLRVMYKNGNAGFLQVLLSSNSIKDFLSRQTMIQSIIKSDKEMIAFMKEQREIVSSKKIELEARRASVEMTKAEIEKQRVALQNATRDKEYLMSRLQQNIKTFEAEYDKLNEYAKQIEKDIVKLQSKNTIYSGGKMEWPVPGFSRISSPYGMRVHPIFKVKKLHTGIDIPAPTGSKIVAAAAGKVIQATTMGGYGKAVIIDHGGGIATLYAHNSSITVSVGQVVGRGEQIARAGSTGNSTGPHLHFEVRKDGGYQDPISWLTR